MIIGYYGAAFFGGAKYLKLYKDENSKKDRYTVEIIKSVIPNMINGADEEIKTNSSIHETVDISRYFTSGGRIQKEYVNNKEVKYIKEYADRVDFEYLSKQKYTSNVLDSLCWMFYIKSDEQEYLIKGYHEIPRDIRHIVLMMEEILKNRIVG